MPWAAAPLALLGFESERTGILPVTQWCPFAKARRPTWTVWPWPIHNPVQYTTLCCYTAVRGTVRFEHKVCFPSIPSRLPFLFEFEHETFKAVSSSTVYSSILIVCDVKKNKIFLLFSLGLNSELAGKLIPVSSDLEQTVFGFGMFERSLLSAHTCN